MADKSSIEWTESTWNPIAGCTHISPGCDHCYAARQASGRLSATPTYAGLAVAGKFTGEIRLLPERLEQPLRWRRPRIVFVNSMSDLFHKDVPDEFIARVFVVMSMARQHTFQVLTKRHGRMRSLLGSDEFQVLAGRAAFALIQSEKRVVGWEWPLPNVWLGVSVENQQWADIRIPALLDTPAAVHWLSCEPLLGPLNLNRWLVDPHFNPAYRIARCGQQSTHSPHVMEHGPDQPRNCPGTGGGTFKPDRLDWVVVGGESGPGARPMHPDWARSLRDQCVAAGVPFFLKQHGEWGPAPWRVDREPGETDEAYKARSEATCATHSYAVWADRYGHQPGRADHKPWSLERCSLPPGQAPMRRWGKKAAGRELDGRTWDEYPTQREPVMSDG